MNLKIQKNNYKWNTKKKCKKINKKMKALNNKIQVRLMMKWHKWRKSYKKKMLQKKGRKSDKVNKNNNKHHKQNFNKSQLKQKSM